MKVIRGMLNSKKWTAAIVTIVALAAQDFFGMDLSPETITAILSVVGLVIGAEGLADAAGARASRKLGERDPDLAESIRKLMKSKR